MKFPLAMSENEISKVVEKGHEGTFSLHYRTFMCVYLITSPVFNNEDSFTKQAA